MVLPQSEPAISGASVTTLGRHRARASSLTAFGRHVISRPQLGVQSTLRDLDVLLPYLFPTPP
jgi:hypothetical protein